jgi:hypothetical protein
MKQMSYLVHRNIQIHTDKSLCETHFQTVNMKKQIPYQDCKAYKLITHGNSYI